MPPKPSRFHDLDALRGALMVWGIAVHATNLGPSVMLLASARLSGLVRMEAFFVISGLLSALVLARSSVGQFMRTRFIMLGLPLIVGLAVLNPLTNYLVYCFHNPPIALEAFLAREWVADPRGPIGWHLHLWFLFALLAYTALSPALCRGVQVLAPRLQRASNPARTPALFLVMCVAITSAAFGSRLIFELGVEPFAPERWHFVIRSILYYSPFFALGALFSRWPHGLRTFSRIHWVHGLIAGGALVLVNLRFELMPKALAESLRLICEAYLSVVLAGALFYLAQRFFSRERAWVRAFSTSAYSVYLLHFLVLYAIATVLYPVVGQGHVLLVGSMILTFITVFAVHHLAIERVPVLRLIFNGRWTPSRRASATAAPAPATLQTSRP